MTVAEIVRAITYFEELRVKCPTTRWIADLALDALQEARARRQAEPSIAITAQGRWVVDCLVCKMRIEGTRRVPRYCANCGVPLEVSDEEDQGF